jgi:hypothetical protein
VVVEEMPVGRRWGERMLWTMAVAVGLGAELWVIIGLGRQVTRRYEAEAGPVAGDAAGLVLPGPAAERARREELVPPRAA